MAKESSKNKGAAGGLSQANEQPPGTGKRNASQDNKQPGSAGTLLPHEKFHNAMAKKLGC